ncbi:hypothetical protein J4G43_027895 [Bradyrhizobium barranii subsp. barranii]|uniref:Uncharacterized protein n=1 Tax=Bradyrhizobium barranii subsp. barranii TaxID=2823807 RepID=A0A939M899_9BRAD|nr:hypothetical protein [Bradyrhizobium barranii]UEM08585.1 hypothetical protein J4G43_027895 [Bradyrhizobium barranii subsp. barranii]
MTEPILTRKPHDNPHQEGWDVYYGDVRIGNISTRAGVPKDVDQWGWRLGFYPGTDVGAGSNGTGESFEECRADFERAWLKLKPTITDADYERWRTERDDTAWKYRMWSEKRLLPTQTRDDRSRCFCGVILTNASIPGHVRTAHTEG